MNGNPFDDMASGGRFKDRLRDRVGRAVVRNQRGGERLRVRLGMMFRARGRLWLGMPAAAVVAFLLCFPLRMIDSPATEALTRGGIAAGQLPAHGAERHIGDAGHGRQHDFGVQFNIAYFHKAFSFAHQCHPSYHRFHHRARQVTTSFLEGTGYNGPNWTNARDSL